MGMADPRVSSAGIHVSTTPVRLGMPGLFAPTVRAVGPNARTGGRRRCHASIGVGKYTVYRWCEKEELPLPAPWVGKLILVNGLDEEGSKRDSLRECDSMTNGQIWISRWLDLYRGWQCVQWSCKSDLG